MAIKLRNDEMMAYDMTQAFMETMRSNFEYEKRKRNATLLADIVDYKLESSNKLFTGLFKYMMNNSEYEKLLISIIELIDTFNFDTQPSVNLKGKDKSMPNGGFQEGNQYQKLSTVTLMQHTANVVAEFIRYSESSKTIKSDTEWRTLAFACLFHDFGKSIALCKLYGLYKEEMEIGEYKHEKLSVKLIEVILGFFNNGSMLKHDVYKSDIVDICSIVAGHHSKKYSADSAHPLTKALKTIDANARQYEMREIMNENNTAG